MSPPRENDPPMARRPKPAPKQGAEPARPTAPPTRPRPGPTAAQASPRIAPRADAPAPRPAATAAKLPAAGGQPERRPQPVRPSPTPADPEAAAMRPHPSVRRTRKPLPPPALASRAERILLAGLLASVLAMGWYLLRFRARAEAHFRALAQPVPLLSAAGAQANITLTLADDQTGALRNGSLAFPLPADPNTRARVVLEKLLDEYTRPDAAHPLPALPPGAESIEEVFLSPAPSGRGLLATVDLSAAFVRLHPSGIESETLTLLSLIGTLHANLPQVAEVRFLVDGEPRATLAGHASLAESYLAGPTAPREAFATR